MALDIYREKAAGELRQVSELTNETSNELV